jgi:hypothetical protein
MDVARARLLERRAQTIASWVSSAALGDSCSMRPGSGPEGYAWQAGSDAGICLTGRRAEAGGRWHERETPWIRKTGWRQASATNASNGATGFASKKGRVIGTSVTYCFKIGAASAGSRRGRCAPRSPRYREPRASDLCLPPPTSPASSKVCHCAGLARSTERCDAVRAPLGRGFALVY